MRVQIGGGTREITTCKRTDLNAGTNGQSCFTLSTFTEDTLSQMFPTQRRAFGVVPGTGATLPNGGDTNNGNPTGYLQQCSTVPSEPGLGSGVYMTIHGFRATAQKDQNRSMDLCHIY